MDIYEFKNELGHSGFEHCRVVDVNSYSEYNADDGVLYEGDIDDAPDNLDDLEITSIDVWYNERTGQIEATIDVNGSPEDEDDGDDFNGEPIDDDAEPRLATDDMEAGQWYE